MVYVQFSVQAILFIFEHFPRKKIPSLVLVLRWISVGDCQRCGIQKRTWRYVEYVPHIQSRMFKDVGSRIWDKIMELSIFNRSYLDNYSELFKKTLYCWKAQDFARSSETIVMNNRSTVLALWTGEHLMETWTYWYGLGHFCLVKFGGRFVLVQKTLERYK